MKKILRNGLIALGVLALLSISVFFITENHYENKFYPNSEYANIDISNMTLADAKSAIMTSVADKKVSVIENEEELTAIPIGEMVNTETIEKDIEKYFTNQHDKTMINDFFGTTTHAFDLSEHVDANSEQIVQALNKAGINNENREPSQDAAIQYNEDEGYSIKEEVYGNQFDYDKVTQQFYNNQTINLNEAYIQPTRTSEDENLQQAIQKIDDLQTTQVTLNIKDNEEVIPQEEVASWIISDSAGNVSVDTAAIESYLSTFNDQYATYGKDRQFESTLSGTVTVPGDYSTMGWSINRSETAAQIAEQLTAGEDVYMDAVYSGSHHDLALGFGDSYIEVDMGKQEMFIYKDGKQVLSTPIISGHPETNTLPGSYYIWNKEKDATLVGYNKRTDLDYETPVNYWLPFDYIGQGIHDASWQTDFGGDTYLTNGSNGCINVDPEIMDEVFNHAEVGMPVVVFN